MYSPLSYIVVNTCVQLPWMLLLGVSALVPAAYGIINFAWSRFGMAVLVFSLQLWAGESVAQACSVGSNLVLLVLVYLLIFAVFFIFGGMMLPPNQVLWPFRACAYFSPLRYSMSLMVYFAHIDDEFDGAVVDSSAPGCARAALRSLRGGPRR